MACPLYFLAALVLFSLLVRLHNLHSPLLEVNHSRQTQTAFTVWYYLQDGIDLMHPKVPSLGPPWVFIMEFPIFQATATFLIRLTRIDVDAGCRLTNIIYFYLSAGMLYLLSRRFSTRRSTAVCVLMFYLWSPFSIVWSRTSIDRVCRRSIWHLIPLFHGPMARLPQECRLSDSCPRNGVPGGVDQDHLDAAAGPAACSHFPPQLSGPICDGATHCSR